jgi:hypothetical protein
MNSIFRQELEKLRFEIRAFKTFEEKLEKWAEFTVEYCNIVAKVKERAYYVFQSEPKPEPDVLILGLNPGGNYNFDSQLEKDGWGLTQHGKMIPEVFIHQNPWYIGGKEAEKEKEWNILRNLNKTINVHSELSRVFDNMVYMNILYFNSTDFTEFKTCFKNDWKEVFDNCIELSKLLIFEIIRPKRILCLGVDNCYKAFIQNSKTEELIYRSLYRSEINGLTICGMTHPSARTSNFERETIGWHLYSDWFKKPIINDIQTKLTAIEKILSDIANESKLRLDFDMTKIGRRFGSFKFYLPDETGVSIYFEFQKLFYSDLRFELHKGRFLRTAKTCVPPYDNWMNLKVNFNQEELRNYFDREIKTLMKAY